MRWFDFTGLQRHLYLLGRNNPSENRTLTLKYIKEVTSKCSDIEGLIELLG